MITTTTRILMPMGLTKLTTEQLSNAAHSVHVVIYMNTISVGCAEFVSSHVAFMMSDV